MKKVFIDGSAGTTGLRIYDRLKDREDISLITLPEEKRKDAGARKEAMDQSDVTFLCLPDDAAREAAGMADADTVVIDASSAHRVHPDFAYGFPELSAVHKERIKQAKRISVPGCHASGFIALVYPLVASGLLPADAALTCHSLTGYSGGGKGMIASYEEENRNPLLDAPRQYALGQTHKHLPEMKARTGLEQEPVFCPIVADYYCGMEVTVPLFASYLRGTKADIGAVYRKTYENTMITVLDDWNEGGFVSAGALAGFDGMQICVAGNEERILLMARYDNLGKGASGAAVQCMNLSIGADETKGLVL
ncbi:MAG: N-acetyl-gamma-glutamyl-phosphate reductase [Clostridiales bacterium]|nr:N-acetyl-gamma-glutamyl-phosphate reductase [Clostridiales bacterium]